MWWRLRGHGRRSRLRGPDRRLDHRTRSPTCGGREKRGSDDPAPSDQALGRSRGGLSTKIHLVVRGLGCPVRFALTAGQQGDAPQAEALLVDLPAAVVLADAADDGDRLRQAIAAKAAKGLIPDNPSRAKKYGLDAALCTERHLIESCVAKLRQFRRVATRHERTARNYAAVVTIAAIVVWLR
ncbi:IS5 family transposase [Methylobacterium sp. JK268]